MLWFRDFCGARGTSRSVNPSSSYVPQLTLSCWAYCVVAYLSSIPFYVVGEATAAAVQEIQLRFKSNGFSCALIRGEQSGTGEQLGRFITDHYDGHGMGKLLYLTGDKNRDTVPSILAENNIPFQALQVYETRQRTDFEVLLDQVVDSLYAEPTPGTSLTCPSSSFPLTYPRTVVDCLFRTVNGEVCDAIRTKMSFLQKHILSNSYNRSCHDMCHRKGCRIYRASNRPETRRAVFG
jgi:hypothetical protein